MSLESTALFIAGHGTKSARGTSQFIQLVEQIKKKSPMPVGYGFIELAQPDLFTALKDLIERSQPSTVIVVPLLLLAAGHVKIDIPSSIANARNAFPDINFLYAKDLSITPQLLEIVEENIRNPFEIIDSAEIQDQSPETTLLVGRGSSDPDANSDLYKIGRILSERNSLNLIEPAFISLAKPDLAAGLSRLKQLGAFKITIAPYFLFHGTLLERIYSQARSWQKDNSEISLALAHEIGPDSRIADLILIRAAETEQYSTFMNCDTCLFKIDLPKVSHNHK